MNNLIRLAYINGAIKQLFDHEVENRIHSEYSERTEKEIMRNMLTDTEAAISYINRVKEIKTQVKAEFEASLGVTVDVGFDPAVVTNGVSDRVDSLENTTDELNEALMMILEGVTK